ncbi:MAG: epoxyqueuosine reductase QueH [Dehalococcoidales bacterium]|nr:epoxyqueuosine reductase QueH [Dehalococcoidales bacterium]
MRIVLHICCGVCAAGAVERLSGEGHQVLGFFYNPNIHPEAEYQRRLAAVRIVARELDFPFEAPPFNPQEWSAAAGHLGDEPEGGRRCEICFRIRLKKTYLYMKHCGYDAFTTTLTISPHKSADVINRVGLEIGGDRFLVRDLKKKDGFRQAIEMAKKSGLYRQDYCGCAYSIKGKR